jgi:hypothetical protein
MANPEHAAADDAIPVAVMGLEEERLARGQRAKGASATRPPEVELVGTHGGEVAVPIAVSHADVGAHGRIIARARPRKDEHRRGGSSGRPNPHERQSPPSRIRYRGYRFRVTDGSVIDTTFDVRRDAGGQDPDSHSRTLRRYHQLLWSKPLPSGAMFTLDAALHHRSELGEFWLSSDAIVHTYSRWTQPRRLVDVIGQVPSEQIGAFYDRACTFGAYTVFPGQVRVDGRWRLSINQARGIHPRIRDRFDLTLECIRRHYAGEASPLANTLATHRSFFALFDDFSGYVNHFLLNDLVTERGAVRLYTDIHDFIGDPLPVGILSEYRQYMRRSTDFVKARNERITRYAAAWLAETGLE